MWRTQVLRWTLEFRSISWCRVPCTFFQQNAISYVESVDYKTVRISQNGKQLFSGGTGSCRIRAAFLQISLATDLWILEIFRYCLTSILIICFYICSSTMCFWINCVELYFSMSLELSFWNYRSFVFLIFNV